jgi:hypothetical protein
MTKDSETRKLVMNAADEIPPIPIWPFFGTPLFMILSVAF